MRVSDRRRRAMKSTTRTAPSSTASTRSSARTAAASPTPTKTSPPAVTGFSSASTPTSSASPTLGRLRVQESERPEMNYIKRLVGLPGETIHIHNGDLYRVVDGKASILRKPPRSSGSSRSPFTTTATPPKNSSPPAGRTMGRRREDQPGERKRRPSTAGNRPTSAGNTTPRPASSAWRRRTPPRTIRYRHYLATPKSGSPSPAASTSAPRRPRGGRLRLQQLHGPRPFNDGMSPSNLELGATGSTT